MVAGRAVGEPALRCPWDGAVTGSWAAAVTADACDPYCPPGWHVHVTGTCGHGYSVDDRAAVFADFSAIKRKT